MTEAIELLDEKSTLSFQGQDHTAGSGFLNELWCYGYPEAPGNDIREHPGCRGRLLSGQGKFIGNFEIVSVWRTPKSFVSSHYCSMRVYTKGGRVYSGRCAGFGMLFKGRRNGFKKIAAKLHEQQTPSSRGISR